MSVVEIKCFVFLGTEERTCGKLFEMRRTDKEKAGE